MDAIVHDVVEEIAADDALAHQAAEAVGEHREHGVHQALLDQRLEAFRVCPIFRHRRVSREGPA